LNRQGEERGRLITFEGGEGAGKSTQIERLGRRLQQARIRTLLTREPGGSPRAETIRSFLLSGKAKGAGTFAEAALFAAARISHVSEKIAPALAKGVWVLCDRFIDSTRVYQGIVGDVEPELIGALERVALAGLQVDLTIILDVPPELGLARAARRREAGAPDRFEQEAMATHRKLRDGFLAVAAAEPHRCVVVNGALDAAEIERLIWQIVAARFGLSASSPEGVATEVVR
jgi:dTMP kinase